MSAAVVQSIYDWLSADTGSGGFAHATGGVGTSLYHVTGPEDVTMPVCVFVVSDPASPARFLSSSVAEESYTFTFSCWTKFETSDAAAALEIDRRLFTRLEGVLLTPTGYDRVRVKCLTRGACEPDEDGYRVDSDYLVRGVRTT